MLAPELDIIIPVYNEGGNIAATLRSLYRTVRTPFRVLICYDMDGDTTLPAIEENRAQYPGLVVEFVRNRGRGLHAAVMAGFAASVAPFVMMFPADDDYNAQIIDGMFVRGKEGAEVVCASRFMRGGSMTGCPLLKRILSRTGNWMLYHLARVPTHDASNGFRLFSRRVIGQIPVESTVGATFSIELLVKAHRLGWRVAEVPAQWFERTAGTSRFKVLKWLPAYLRWCAYAFVTTCWHRHRALTVLLAAVALLSAIPVFYTIVYIGPAWQGVPPVYMDEYIYYAHVTEAGTGNVLFGNPYLLEHRLDPPLVLFGSTVLAAIPLLLGIPLVPTVVLDFVVWSLVFAALYYWLLREFALPQWLSSTAALFAYVQSYSQIYRVSVRQEVFPFLLLFWLVLIRFIKNPRRRTMFWLAAATGATFYIYGFLWQTAVVTLGLLMLYALATKQWGLLKYTLAASALGGVIGAPAFLYTLWVTYQPYFWESMDRFGVVYTHLPEAEVLYSGGWAGLAVLLAVLLYWRAPALRSGRAFVLTVLFVCVTGLALWSMQASNLITGKLLETGGHMRYFIIMWLPFATALLSYLWYSYRINLHRALRWTAAGALILLAGANLYFGYYHLQPFREPGTLRDTWVEQQSYAAPLAWLEAAENKPVVVWGDPALFSTIHIPVLTKHYVLYEEAANYMLLSTDEVRERYLISRYFDGVTVESLKEDMLPHAGRANTFHLPKTIERQIKICRILFWWDKGHDCGTPPMPQELMGEAYFEGLATRFANDIKPNIGAYLKKYHVSYILKDDARNAAWHPEQLGGTLVYDDGHFALYRLGN